jgi:predicted small secreted protein
MKRLIVLALVAAVALLGCQTMDKGMDEDMDDEMESGQMDESMDEDGM